MYHRGESRAEMWRLKTVPPVAFNRVRTNLIEGGMDVPSGDLLWEQGYYPFEIVI